MMVITHENNSFVPERFAPTQYHKAITRSYANRSHTSKNVYGTYIIDAVSSKTRCIANRSRRAPTRITGGGEGGWPLCGFSLKHGKWTSFPRVLRDCCSTVYCRDVLVFGRALMSAIIIAKLGASVRHKMYILVSHLTRCCTARVCVCVCVDTHDWPFRRGLKLSADREKDVRGIGNNNATGRQFSYRNSITTRRARYAEIVQKSRLSRRFVRFTRTRVHFASRNVSDARTCRYVTRKNALNKKRFRVLLRVVRFARANKTVWPYVRTHVLLFETTKSTRLSDENVNVSERRNCVLTGRDFTPPLASA